MTPDVPELPELAQALGRGRHFTQAMRPMLADCAPSGRVRLDALARWLQDVAYADIEEVALQDTAVWVIRRARLKVLRFPRFGERFELDTFASGLGRMWAERRTTVRAIPGGGGPLASTAATALVEAAVLWIHLDPVRGVPVPLGEQIVSAYAEAAGDRRFSHRLTHPRPQQPTSECDWVFRRTDTDLADHVNNAAYWEALEEELLGAEGDLAEIDVEFEFRTPAQPGPVRVLAEGPYRWLTDPESGEVYASILIANSRTTSGSN